MKVGAFVRAVIQRVSYAQVWVEDEVVGEVGQGLLILLGIKTSDDASDVEYLVNKIAGLRIFPNEEGKMDLSLNDTRGEALVVSQFTLYGDCSKGRRPNFTQAARPDHAEGLYEMFCAKLRQTGVSRVATGRFGATMSVSLCNDGPVTLIVESPPERTS